MMVVNRRRCGIVVLFSFSLLAVALVPLSGQEGSSYNPWLDYNDDGIINAYDLQDLGQAYGATGTPLSMPMSLAYDSDWIDIRDKRGQYFDINPGFNLETTTWMPSIYGKIKADTQPHQKGWYGYGLPGWNQTYAGKGGDDLGYSLVQTSDGGYALAGQTSSFGAGLTDFWLVKTDARGMTSWDNHLSPLP